LLVLYERMHILPPSSMFSSCSFQCNATWWRHMLCTALTLTLHYRYHYHHYHHEMSATWLMCVYIIYISIYLNMCSVYSSLPSLVYSCRLLIFLFYHVVFVDIQNSLFRLLSSSKCFFFIQRLADLYKTSYDLYIIYIYACLKIFPSLFQNQIHRVDNWINNIFFPPQESAISSHFF